MLRNLAGSVAILGLSWTVASVSLQAQRDAPPSLNDLRPAHNGGTSQVRIDRADVRGIGMSGDNALYQTEKPGIYQYVPPEGKAKALKENVVAFSEFDQATSAPGTLGSASAPGRPTLDRYGNLFISPPTRQLTIADLVGNWGDNPGRIATTYVYRSNGAYAGTDSLAYTSKSTIDSDGRYVNDFFEVRNGQKLRDITTGTVAIAGRVLIIRQKGTTKYFIRGWLELPDMTIMKLIGPWYDNQEIPVEIFNNPEQGENLSAKWIRLKQ